MVTQAVDVGEGFNFHCVIVGWNEGGGGGGDGGRNVLLETPRFDIGFNLIVVVFWM